MAKKANPTIGHMECLICKEILGRTTRVAVQLQSEGEGMAYYICDGRADPDGKACGAYPKFGYPATARMKKLLAESERKAKPQPEEKETDDNEPDAVSAGDGDGDGKPEPAKRAEPVPGRKRGRFSFV